VSKYLNIADKMVLGTAQFGMNYGIANVSGKPTKKEIFKILLFAWEKGIRNFDTAPGYGSEKVLGEFIVAHKLQNEIKVMTKIPALNDFSDYQQTIKSNLEISLEHLGCPIDVLFFHNPADSILLLENPDYFKAIINEYPVSTFGVSVYEPEEVEKLSECQVKLAFQFPYNVLDRRFENISMRPGKRYARSIFLQGLLASKDSLSQDAPKGLLTLQKNYHNKLAENNLNPIQFALFFVANSKNIDYFVFGVDTLDQLIYILNMNSYEGEQTNIVNAKELSADHKLLDPRTWN